MSEAEFITIGPRAKNITNQRFGRLVALGPISRGSHNRLIWLCLCDCGNITKVPLSGLSGNRTRSCGCFAREDRRRRATKHEMLDSPVYNTWAAIVQRCTNPNCPAYKDYGARGIEMYADWRSNFKNFHNYTISLPNFGRKGRTLDRTNNDLGYIPGNLRWATQKEQTRNARKNLIVQYRGKEQCLAAWCEELGLKYGATWARLKHGWTPELAFETPLANNGELS